MCSPCAQDANVWAPPQRKECQEDGCKVLESIRLLHHTWMAGKDAKKMAATRVLKEHQTFAQHMVVGKDAKKMAATMVLNGNIRLLQGIHGGGKRCQEDGCKSGAEGATDKCILHGGGKRCQEPGCNSSARSLSDFCIIHGGGYRCAGINCQGAHSVQKIGDLCAFCSPAKEGKYSKKKEQAIVDLLTKNDIKFDGETTIKYCNNDDNKKRARLDFVIEHETHRSILSVDENSHKGNPVSCEVSRMTKVMESIALADRSRPTTWIRYNPDTYRVNKKIQKVSDKKRHERLLALIKTVPKCDFEVRYLYYNVDKNNVLELFSDAEYSDQFKKFVVSVN